MIKAKSSDKKLVCELLTSSFAENASVNFIISGDANRPRRIAALMIYSFEMCMRFGEVWLSDDKKGCALLLFPQNKRTTIRSVWLDVNLICRAVGLGGIKRVLRRERLVADKRSKEDMGYLWFIGVNPEHQHLGIGSVLFAEIIKRCNELNLPVYLETSVPENIPWYARFGIRVYDEANVGYRLFFLRR